MRYSELFGVATKQPPADAKTVNHKLLTQGGFVHQELAGVFSFLPLGLRVLNKIEDIVREEMNAIGGQEMLMSALHPKDNWVKTGRWDTVDVLFKVPSQTGNEYALGATHEEIIAPLAQKYINSYKDLPFMPYQIQTKFRDELRAKSGVMRGREFRMKDLYTFHPTKEAFNEFYFGDLMKAYLNVFKRCGLEAKIAEASGGDFTDKFSHEFLVLTTAGEDEILYCNDCSFARNVEVAEGLKECPECKSKDLRTDKAAEVGNIFDLETRFSEAFNITFENKEGKRELVHMGCHGLGTSRLMATIVEVHNDQDGIIWPEEVAPYHLHLVGLDLDDEAVRKEAESLYAELTKKGIDVLFDDRDERAGVKFGTADLIGIPYRVVVSKKTLEQKKFELKKRGEEESSHVEKEELLSMLS